MLILKVNFLKSEKVGKNNLDSGSLITIPDSPVWITENFIEVNHSQYFMTMLNTLTELLACDEK